MPVVSIFRPCSRWSPWNGSSRLLQLEAIVKYSGRGVVYPSVCASLLAQKLSVLAMSLELPGRVTFVKCSKISTIPVLKQIKQRRHKSKLKGTQSPKIDVYFRLTKTSCVFISLE